MKSATTLRFGSFNTWSGCIPGQAGRRDHIVDFIVELAQTFDYLVLHEVHVSNDSLSERFIPARSPGHRPGPLDLKLGNRLMDRLKATHRYMFAPHFTVTALHDYEATDLPVYYGNLVLIKRQVVVVRNEIAMIYGNGQVSTEILHRESGHVTGRAGSRKANVTTIDTGYDLVTVAGVHGLHSRAGKIDNPARVAQSAKIAAVIAQQRKWLKLGTDNPYSLVIGDLNLTSENEVLQQLLENPSAFGFNSGINLNSRFKITDTRTKWYSKSKPSREANFALASTGLAERVTNYTVHRRTPSVHGYTDLTIEKKPGT